MNNDNMNNNQFDPNMQQNNPNMGQPNQFSSNQGMNNQFNPNMQQNNPQFNPSMGPNNQFNSNPGMITNDPNQNGKKPMDTKTIIIIAIVIVAALVSVYFLFIKKDDNISDGGKGGSTGTGTVKEKVKLEEKISVSEYGQVTDKYGSMLILKVDNKNSQTISADISVDFYDESGNIVDTDDGYISCISKNSSSYVRILIEKEFSKYEYNVKADDYAPTCVEAKDINVSVNESEDEYLIQVKNNSSYASVDYSAYIAMYKDNKLLDVGAIYKFDIRSGSSDTEKVMYPYNRGYIKPDRYEILVNGISGKN